jgi:hypothetical protein
MRGLGPEGYKAMAQVRPLNQLGPKMALFPACCLHSWGLLGHLCLCGVLEVLSIHSPYSFHPHSIAYGCAPNMCIT